MSEELFCITEEGVLSAEAEAELGATPGVTLRRGNTGGLGCLLFSQGAASAAFFHASSFDESIASRVARAAKTFQRATLLLPNASLGSPDLLAYTKRLATLDRVSVVLTPAGAAFPAHALVLARAALQGCAAAPTWAAEQRRVMRSSEVTMRVLSGLPALRRQEAEGTGPGAATTAQILSVDLGSVAAVAAATSAQLEAAGLCPAAAVALQAFFTQAPQK